MKLGFLNTRVRLGKDDREKGEKVMNVCKKLIKVIDLIF